MGLESLVKQFSDVLLRVALSASLALTPVLTSACKGGDNKNTNTNTITNSNGAFSLDGIVRSSYDNRELYGVKVTMLDQNGSASNLTDTTDARGHYQIPSVPQGTKTIRFEFNNYQTKDEVISIINANKTFDVIISPKTNISIPSPVTTNLVLKKEHSPYIAEEDGNSWGEFLVARGAKLTVEPGITIKIPINISMTVYGAIEVLGTQAQPVTFTVDSNTLNYWKGIKFNADTLMQQTNLSNLIIRYATNGITMNNLGNNSIQLFQSQNMIIENCKDSGIRLLGTNTSAIQATLNATINNCKYGVYPTCSFNSGNKNISLSNIIIKNCNYGIYSEYATLEIKNSQIKDCVQGINRDGIILRDTVVENCSTGIYVHGYNYGLLISNCRIKKCGIGTGNEPIYFGSGGGDIQNSIIENIENELEGVYSINYCTFVGNQNIITQNGSLSLINSIFWNNSNQSSMQSSFPGNLFVDPKFIDQANGNYRLQSSSPAKTASSTGGEIGAYGNGGSPP